MIIDSTKLKKGQLLKVNKEKVQDRLPRKIIKEIDLNPIGKLIGYKMVDGNQFGLALEFSNGKCSWFFEDELSETEDNKEV